MMAIGDLKTEVMGVLAELRVFLVSTIVVSSVGYPILVCIEVRRPIIIIVNHSHNHHSASSSSPPSPS
jgi:hypothetical protein